jgi:hypothetical protein
MAGHRDPLYCQHDRTAASCEACAHADARADDRRAPVTRKELYLFPNGRPLTTAWLAEEPPRPAAPTKGRRRS